VMKLQHAAESTAATAAAVELAVRALPVGHATNDSGMTVLPVNK